MSHDEIVTKWLQSKCGNTSMKDDILDMMQQARINAFREVRELLDTYSFDECTHPNELLEESIPDFKEATK